MRYTLQGLEEIDVIHLTLPISEGTFLLHESQPFQVGCIEGLGAFRLKRKQVLVDANGPIAEGQGIIQWDVMVHEFFRRTIEPWGIDGEEFLGSGQS